MISKYQLIKNINEALEDHSMVKAKSVDFDGDNLADFLKQYPYYQGWLAKYGYLSANINRQLVISYK